MTFDLAVIGGGVVGCALFRRFALGGLKTVLLERGADILSGVSKANSAMLHTGFDAPPGSLEQACIQAGHAEYLAIRGPLNLPLLETGGLMVAWTEEELAAAARRGRPGPPNGVADVRQVDAAEVLTARAPSGARCAGRRHRAARACHRSLVGAAGLCAAGAWPMAARCGGAAAVNGGDFDGKAWRLATSTGPVEARIVVNAAGLQGDVVEAIARPSPFTIKPRKGQFVVFDKPAARLITACIMPVPSERTKGVMVARTIFGNLLVGPTAEEQEDREHATVDRAAARGPDRPGPAHAAGAGRREASRRSMPGSGPRPSSRTIRSRRWRSATGSRPPGSAPPV